MLLLLLQMKFESSGSSSQLDINDPNFWSKLAPVNDGERFSPDQLLSQLTDNSALASAQTRAEFFKYMSACTERILRLKRQGEEVSAIDDLQSLLIQFAATAAFSDSQRRQARAWLEEAERRVERKARAKTFPAVANRRVAKQRGHMNDYDDRRRRGGPTKFGRITNVDDSSNDDMDSGSDFGGDESPADEEAADEEHEEGGRGRRHNKQRVARGLKRRKGLLNLDICEICNQSGRLISCDGPCQGWFHLGCAGLDECPPDDVDFVCDRCKDKRHPCHGQSNFQMDQERASKINAIGVGGTMTLHGCVCADVCAFDC